MSYQKWIALNLEHSYFVSGRCPALRFSPTDDCRDRMRRGKQFFFPMPDGFVIFNDTANVTGNQTGAAERCFFDIALYSADPLFGNYSNLEIDYRQGRVYYISNTPGSSTQDKEKRLTLTNRQDGAQLEAVPVHLKPKQFVIRLDNAAPGSAVRLLDGGNEVLQQLQVSDQPGTSFYVDVSRKRAGLYSLEIDGKITAYFYADDQLVNTRPAVIIGIDAPKANRDNAVQRYDIMAASRGVTWEYHVFAIENHRKLNNLEIRNGNEKQLSGIVFQRVRIDEERNEVVFESNQVIPLTEQPYQSIELTEKGGVGAPLIPHLPNADISSLHVKEGKWVSRINVYI